MRNEQNIDRIAQVKLGITSSTLADKISAKFIIY